MIKSTHFNSSSRARISLNSSWIFVSAEMLPFRILLLLDPGDGKSDEFIANDSFVSMIPDAEFFVVLRSEKDCVKSLLLALKQRF